MEITYHGTSVVSNGQTYRLKDLLPVDQLALGSLRILDAKPAGEDLIALYLSDGLSRSVPLIEDQSLSSPPRLTW